MKIVTLGGGKGDLTRPDQVDPTQLSIGIQVEMEHTNDPKIAQEIALDHLTEDPEYYTKLIKAGLADEFGGSASSGLGDPDQSFNDPARVGEDGILPGNVKGSIGGTSDGQVDGRASEPLINKSNNPFFNKQNKTMDIELDEKKKGGKKRPKPTNPALWARAKAAARSKFDVYPSAYANGWAAKWYKSKGGGWRMSEETTSNEGVVAQVFDGPSPTETSPDGLGTYGSGYDYVGYAENKQYSMKEKQLKESIKKIIRKHLREQEGGDEPVEVGADQESVTITLDKDLAQKLHDLLMTQLAPEGSDLPPSDEPQSSAPTQDNDQLPPSDSEVETGGDETEETPSTQMSTDTGDEGADEDALGEITFEQSREIEETKKKWIQNAIKPSKKGALHKQLDVPQGEKIPAGKLAAAAKKGGKLGQRARLAITLGKLKKGKKKK
jgi:hypothetical protein